MSMDEAIKTASKAFGESYRAGKRGEPMPSVPEAIRALCAWRYYLGTQG